MLPLVKNMEDLMIMPDLVKSFTCIDFNKELISKILWSYKNLKI